MNDYFLIIDGSSLLATQFFGNLPREIMFAKTLEEKEKYYHKIMKTSKGVYTNGVYGFLRYLFRLLKDIPPKYLVINWDLSRDTFRRELYPDYKAQRSEVIEPLVQQFDLCREILAKMGIRELASDRYEADDFSGTVSARFENEIPVKIISKDRDYLQLVSDKTELWIMHSSAVKTEEVFKKYNMNPKKYMVSDRCFPLTPELVLKEYGVEPMSVASLKGLEGDPSDNIKGVPGVGEKAAMALISYYKTVDALYDELKSLDEAGRAALNLKWKNELGITRSPMNNLLKTDDTALVGEAAARLSTTLATIKRDVPLEWNELSDYELKFDSEAAKACILELEMNSLVDEIPSFAESAGQNEIIEINDLCEADELISRLAKSGKTIGYAAGKLEDDTPYFALSDDETLEYRLIPEAFLTEDFILDRLCDECKKGMKISAFNIKNVPFLMKAEKPENTFDPSVAAYLLAPLKGDYGTKSVLADFLPKALSLTEAAAAFALAPVLREKLEKEGMSRLYREIEIPLAYVLSNMEKRGIIADKKELGTLSANFGARISELEKTIYSEAGEEFNINSPKQLGVVLFEHLNLPHGKKTKTGYSTAVEVLEELKEGYPVVAHILEYRQLSKLKSTYADALADCIAEDGRIHCKLNQTVTATGRLSCTEPNLQNIPVRTEIGREIRKVFVPAPGCVFVDADYSQIELRVLASLSKDSELIAAYNEGRDIHALTASKVFGIPLEKVTSVERGRAKAVNFGIVYGISNFGLGQGLGISWEEAKDFIDKYFETYPSIKQFLDGLVSSAYDKGCARTAFGRIRPIPELSSGNFNLRSFGERVAMNSPIQGTAADIIKIAMLRVENRLKRDTKGSKLLLQIHDELLIEAPEEEKETVKQILLEEMPAAWDGGVRLEVEVNEGSSWYEVK